MGTQAWDNSRLEASTEESGDLLRVEQSCKCHTVQMAEGPDSSVSRGHPEKGHCGALRLSVVLSCGCIWDRFLGCSCYLEGEYISVLCGEVECLSEVTTAAGEMP